MSRALVLRYGVEMLRHVEILRFDSSARDEEGVFPLLAHHFLQCRTANNTPASILTLVIVDSITTALQIMQRALQPLDLLPVHQPLHPHVRQILILHNLNSLRPQPPLLQLDNPRLVRLDVHSRIPPARRRPVHPRAMHAEVEFVGVAIGGLGAHGFEAILLDVVIAGAELVVGFLFEEAEVGAGEGLGTLLVGDAFYGVA